MHDPITNPETPHDVQFGVEWLGGGFEYILFSSSLGEMIQFDFPIFFSGWVGELNHQVDV